MKERFCIVFLFQFLIFITQYTFGQQSETDSLLYLIKTEKQDTSKVIHLNHLAFQYYLQSDLHKAIATEDTAIALANKISFLRGYADACSAMGNFCTDQQNYSRAWDFFSKAMKAFQILGNRAGIASLKNRIGVFYDSQGNYPQALTYYLDALNMEKQIGNKKAIASFLGDIGTLYWEQGSFDKALEYYLDAMKIYQKVTDKFNMAITVGNIGLVYDDKKEYDKALSYYNQAIQIEEDLNDREGIARNKSNIAELLAAQGKYSESLKYCDEALKIFIELGQKKGAEVVTSNIGLVYFKEGKYKKAEPYLLSAGKDAEAANDIEEIKDVNKRLYDLYMAAGQTKNAFDSYRRYIAARDTLMNETRSREIGRIEAKAEYEKQLEIRQAEENKNNALRKAERDRQNMTILLVAVIALASILVAVNIFRLLKTTRRQKLFTEQQKIVQELNALRAQMNPHFIFNAVNAIKNVVLNNDAATASRHLSTFSKLMRGVLENSKHENITLEKELNMLKLYIDLELLRFSSRFSYSISVDDSIDTEKTLISPLIIQPYAENAIRHGLMHLENNTGNLSIKIEMAGSDTLKCIIDDNGIGREKSAEIKKGKNHKSMGLSITQERLNIINSIYRSNIRVVITDKANADGSSAGTRAELFLPLILANIKHD